MRPGTRLQLRCCLHYGIKKSRGRIKVQVSLIDSTTYLDATVAEIGEGIFLAEKRRTAATLKRCHGELGDLDPVCDPQFETLESSRGTTMCCGYFV